MRNMLPRGGVLQIAGHDVRLDPCDQRLQGLYGPPGASRDHPFILSAGQFDPFGTGLSPSQQACFRECPPPCGRRSRADDTKANDRRTSRPGAWASWFGPAILPGIGLLGTGCCTTFRQAAGFLDPGNLDHLHLSDDHVQPFADILTPRTKGATPEPAGHGRAMSPISWRFLP